MITLLLTTYIYYSNFKPQIRYLQIELAISNLSKKYLNYMNCFSSSKLSTHSRIVCMWRKITLVNSIGKLVIVWIMMMILVGIVFSCWCERGQCGNCHFMGWVIIMGSGDMQRKVCVGIMRILLGWVDDLFMMRNL